MKIVIVGDGKVGFNLAKQLVEEGHDVTIIDNQEDVLESTIDVLDCEGMLGDGTSYDVLKAANTDTADLLVAVTSADEINMISCLLAKKLGAKNTIARIRNPGNEKSVGVLKDELGLSMQINPERESAREIMRSIRYSKDVKVSSFSKSRIELCEIKVHQGNPLIGQDIRSIGNKYKDVLICTIKHGDDLTIAHGNSVIQEGDKISVTGRSHHLEDFFTDIQHSKHCEEIRDVMIVGGSRIAFYLTKMLLDSDIEVTVIEQNEKKCIEMSEKFPEATIIQGDGTTHELLRSENIEQMDAFIALTGNDEENVIVSMYASSRGVEHVIPKINRMSFDFLLEKLELENAISPKKITANHITQYVRAMENAIGSNVESLVKIVDGRAEALEFNVRQNCRFLDQPLKDIHFKDDVLIAYITHKGSLQLARGDSTVQVGDTLSLISKQTGLTDINDVLAE